MARIILIFIAWFAAVSATAADYEIDDEDGDLIWRVKELMNPGLRFNSNQYRTPTLKGHFSTDGKTQSFAIEGLVEGHTLVLDVHSGQPPKARFVSVKDDKSANRLPLVVSLESGKFDRTNQSLERRVTARQGAPDTVVFGVYWEMSEGGLGPDLVVYTLAYRTKPGGEIRVVHCEHDLRGTPLEAPRRAAADLAAGAIMSHSLTLISLAVAMESATEEERAQLLPRLQRWADGTVFEIAKLTLFTTHATPLVARQARSALEQANKVGVAARLVRSRDRKLASSYLEPEAQTRLDAILTSWAASGIPFTSANKKQ